jgi:putative DNA primase/helicase
MLGDGTGFITSLTGLVHQGTLLNRLDGFDREAFGRALLKHNNSKAPNCLPSSELTWLINHLWIREYRENGYAATELGLAQHFSRLFGRYFKLRIGPDDWWHYSGRRWVQAADSTMLQAMSITARIAAGEGHSDQRNQRPKQSVLHSAHKLKGAIKTAAALAELRAPPKEFDRGIETKINLLSGLLDLRTGELVQHTPKNLITHCAPVIWNSRANDATFDRFIHDLCGGDQELQQFLQRAVGRSLMATHKEDAFFILVGPGGTGKTTFLRIWDILLGPLSQSINPSVLLKSNRSGGPAPELLSMQGKRFVFASEIDSDQQLSEATLKRLASNDQINARPMYAKSETVFEAEVTLWIAVNELPQFDPNDSGIQRRLVCVPITNVIAPERRQANLLQKLTAPNGAGAAAMRWAVDGAEQYLRSGLEMPPVVRDFTAELLLRKDPVGRFIDAMCFQRQDASISTSDFFQEQKRWGEAQAIAMPQTASQVGKILRKKGFASQHTRTGNRWVGIGLRPECEGGEGKNTNLVLMGGEA